MAGRRPARALVRTVAVGAVLAALLVPGTWGAARSPGASPLPAPSSSAPAASPSAQPPAPELADPATIGRALVTRYTDLVVAKDSAGLEAFLDPAFQILRANGDHYTRDAYLAQGLPDILAYEIGDVTATRSGDALIVVWQITSTQLVDGVEQPTGPAPRMSTFVWADGRWQLAGHANFGTINR